jgi:hypothetical protein
MAATNFYDDLQDWLKNKRGSAGRTTVVQDSPATMSWVTQGFNGPPPSAHLGLDPGFTPNYEALIRSDPAYLSWRNSGQLDMSSAAAARKAALDALVVRYRGKGAFTDQYGDIDQNRMTRGGTTGGFSPFPYSFRISRGISSTLCARASSASAGAKDGAAGGPPA